MRKVIILSGLICFFNAKVEACTCLGPFSIDTAFVHSAVVFRGRIISVQEETVFLNRQESLMVFNFEILEQMRGVNPNVTKLTLFGEADQCCSCEYYFKEGEEYIVFADYDGRGLLGTSTCTRTAIANAFSKNDLERLAYVTKRYNDNFDFTYRGWANEHLRHVPVEKEEIRILLSAVREESDRAKLFLYIAFAMGLWSAICTGWIFLKFRKSS